MAITNLSAKNTTVISAPSRNAASRSCVRTARIVVLLAERVDITTDGLDVRLLMDGLCGLAREKLAGGIGEAA